MHWQWISAWWRQITGPPERNPWDDDPRIRTEREGQHDRITRSGEGTYYDAWNQRVRDSWRPRDHNAR